MEYFATGQYGHLELALFMEHVQGFGKKKLIFSRRRILYPFRRDTEHVYSMATASQSPISVHSRSANKSTNCRCRFVHSSI